MDVSLGYVRAKYPGFPFAEVAVIGNNIFQFEFYIGTTRIYVFGVGDILLCSFDVTVLQSK